MDRIRAGELIAGLRCGSVHGFEEHLPAIKRFRVAARCVAFHSPQAHQGEKRVFLKPTFTALRLKSLHEVTNFPFSCLSVKMHKYVGLSHIAVVFWDLVFQYKMITEGIPG